METPQNRMMSHQKEAKPKRGRPPAVRAKVRCSHCGTDQQPKQYRSNREAGTVDIRCSSCGSVFRMTRAHYEALTDGDLIQTRKH